MPTIRRTQKTNGINGFISKLEVNHSIRNPKATSMSFLKILMMSLCCCFKSVSICFGKIERVEDISSSLLEWEFRTVSWSEMLLVLLSTSALRSSCPLSCNSINKLVKLRCQSKQNVGGWRTEAWFMLTFFCSEVSRTTSFCCMLPAKHDKCMLSVVCQNIIIVQKLISKEKLLQYQIQVPIGLTI